MAVSRNPLQALLRVRRLEVLTARRHLANRIAEEAGATERHAAAVAAVIAEAKAAGDGDTLAFFGAWIRRGIADRDRAEAARAAASQETELARDLVAAARAAERAVETALERVDAEQAAATARKTQASLDEAGALRPDDDRTTG